MGSFAVRSRGCSMRNTQLAGEAGGEDGSYVVSLLSQAEGCAGRGRRGSTDNDQRPIPVDLSLRRCPYNSAPVSLSEVLGPASSLTARYRKINTIGRGAFGEAYIVQRNPLYPMPARHRGSNEGEKRSHEVLNGCVGDKGPSLFVAKVMDLTLMSPNDRRHAQSEVMCLACNNHFAIVQYYEHFFVDDDNETIVIITEYADRGDLHRILYQKNSGWDISEADAGTFFVQLLLGLDHIHRRRMIHRDIKAANIFLTSRGLLKLGDFGFSQQYDSTVSNPIACTFLGTSYYVAPEMWKGQRYGKKADIWAAGIVLCELLGRRRPFETDSIVQMRELVLSGTMWLPPTFPDGAVASRAYANCQENQRYISREMREFLELILQRDPEKRPSASELLKTPLMQHYFCVFQKQVDRLIAIDDELEKKHKENPAQFEGSLPEYNFFSEARTLLLEGLAEGKEIINMERERERAMSSFPYFESVVYKESASGMWKERYLILMDGFLIMTLAKGRNAASFSERSRKVSLDAIKSVVPVILDIPVSIDISGDSGSAKAKYGFAISTQNSPSALFVTRTKEERDQWLSVLIVALKMD